jgi:hypothetical protein
VYLARTTLLLLFITFGVVAPQPLEEWYYQTQIAPALQRDLGFTAETRRINPQFEGECFVITSVVGGGIFDRAGTKAAVFLGITTVIPKSRSIGTWRLRVAVAPSSQ